MATGGGLVFGGDVNGRFRAFDHETGEVLWEIKLGSPVTGYPISFVTGRRQYVAVSTGSAAQSSTQLRITPSGGRAPATTCSSSPCRAESRCSPCPASHWAPRRLKHA